MPKIEIKSRSGKVLYSSEALSLKECLENAVKDMANLYRADLSGADLSGAYLSGVYLSRACLSGDIKIKKQPIQISTPRYYVMIFDNHMKIGCEFHRLKDWWGFDDERISAMDSAALKWWKKWWKPLRVVCKAEGRK